MATPEEDTTEEASGHIKVGEPCPKCGEKYTTPIGHVCKTEITNMRAQRKAAEDIRDAADNLNELVGIGTKLGLVIGLDVGVPVGRSMEDEPRQYLHVTVHKPI